MVEQTFNTEQNLSVAPFLACALLIDVSGFIVSGSCVIVVCLVVGWYCSRYGLQYRLAWVQTMIKCSLCPDTTMCSSQHGRLVDVMVSSPRMCNLLSLGIVIRCVISLDQAFSGLVNHGRRGTASSLAHQSVARSGGHSTCRLGWQVTQALAAVPLCVWIAEVFTSNGAFHIFLDQAPRG